MITHKQFFYILSYPRCRSTWFSQFLSTNVSYCFHELLSNNQPKIFWQQMESVPRPYVGSADTNPVSFSMAERRPGPMAIIYRPEKEVIESLKKAFIPHPAFNKDEWQQYLENTIDMFSVILDWYRQNEPNVKVWQFEELEDNTKIHNIWKHLIPEYECGMSLIEKFQSLKISLKSKLGMTNGINSSAKNRGWTIEQFKSRHLDKYNHDKFKEEFSKCEPIKNEERRIVLAR